MNQIFTFLLLVGLINTTSGQIYVDADATGSADGSSWADAFNHPLDALSIAQDGDEIWIAEGVYRPSQGAGDSTSTFRINSAVKIYGGFNGTESDISQRQLSQHKTRLSGDLANNDIPGNLLMNREDNAWHVISIANGITEGVLLNALHISNGHTKAEFDSVNTVKNWGGGIISLSKVDISNCVFDNNFARSGGCVMLFGSATDGSTINQCNFSSNRGQSQSACLFFSGVNNASVTNSTFESNITTRGVIYPLNCVDLRIDNCIFRDNVPTFNTNFGGVYFNFQSIGTEFTNCQFLNNESGNGGVCYDDGRNVAPGVLSTSYSNCTFDGNIASDWGGGSIYSWIASYIIEDCTFKNSRAPNTGGAIYIGGNQEKAISIRSSSFESNEALGGWGGAIANYGSNMTVEDCSFEENNSVTSGGAVTTGFQAISEYSQCFFNGNTARFGGASYTQNDTSSTSFFNCIFEGNSGSDNGGAVYYASAADHRIVDCRFELNITPGVGGALLITDPDDQDAEKARLDLTRSSFLQNFADEAGGAMAIFNADVRISSSLYAGNAVLNDGLGGAITHNAFAPDSSILSVYNNTFVDNIASIANGIATFTDDMGIAKVNLQNNIFNHIDLKDVEVEDGTPEIISYGGNLASDPNLSNILDQTNDSTGEDPLFVNINTGDYRLQDGSPAINKGIANFRTPSQDLENNPRVGNPDKGAYENQNVTSTNNLLASSLHVYPTITSDFVFFEITNNDFSYAQASVIDQSGKVLFLQHVEGQKGALSGRINVSMLGSGTYFLDIASSGAKASAKFVVQ